MRKLIVVAAFLYALLTASPLADAERHCPSALPTKECGAVLVPAVEWLKEGGVTVVHVLP